MLEYEIFFNYKSKIIFLPKIPVEMPPIPKVDNDTLVMIIEQLLMLLLIIGRWMLPKVRRKQEINPESRLMLVLLYRAA